ncbi:MAG: endonuclease/exonuclease/phosphatase family protein [Phycisphaerales bacterium]
MSDQRPKGIIAWVRRRPMSWASKLAALIGLAMVGAWGAGRWFNDDHLWSQFLFWIPTLAVVVIGWVLVLVSGICSRMSLRMGGVMLRPFLALACLLLTVWMLFGEWRVQRYFMPSDARPTDLRVVHWNMSVAQRARGAGDVILAQHPDVALVVNIRTDDLRQSLYEQLATLGGKPAEGESAGADVHFLNRGTLVVATRLPIRRWGVVALDAVESKLEEWRSGWDPGRVYFLELDTSGEASMGGRPLIVWALDLPSDPTMSRAEVMRAAARAVKNWQGPVYAPDGIGRWIPSDLVDVTPDEATGFPKPDLVIGDFNTPRGSHSVRALVGDMDGAFAQAGRGAVGTWPRRFPLWQIDQAFVGGDVEATRYRILNPGMSEHRMQVVDLRRE